MIEDSQDATLGRGRSQSTAVDAVEQVEADPGAVFEAHGATSVDELVAGDDATGVGAAGDDEAADDGPDGCTADDVAVAAMFEDGIEAPATTTESTSASESSEANSEEDREALLDELERSATGCDSTETEHADSGGTEREGSASEPLVEDDEVAAALQAAEAVHEGDLPEEIPFK